MGNKNYNITASDFIFGSVNAGGQTLASLAASGYNSIEDIARQLRLAAGRFLGLARISIRNTTQGWNVELPIACAAVRPRRCS